MTKPLVRVCIDCGKTATVKEARQQLWLPIPPTHGEGWLCLDCLRKYPRYDPDPKVRAGQKAFEGEGGGETLQ